MFQFEINEKTYLYIGDEYEPTTILDRKTEGGMNYYLTDVHPNWQREPFLRKA